MKATITIEIDVTDFVEDENKTIPDAEKELEKIIKDVLSNEFGDADSMVVSIQ